MGWRAEANQANCARRRRRGKKQKSLRTRRRKVGGGVIKRFGKLRRFAGTLIREETFLPLAERTSPLRAEAGAVPSICAGIATASSRALRQRLRGPISDRPRSRSSPAAGPGATVSVTGNRVPLTAIKRAQLDATSSKDVGAKRGARGAYPRAPHQQYRPPSRRQGRRAGGVLGTHTPEHRINRATPERGLASTPRTCSRAPGSPRLLLGGARCPVRRNRRPTGAFNVRLVH